MSHMGKIISRLSDEAVERDEERTWVAGRRRSVSAGHGFIRVALLPLMMTDACASVAAADRSRAQRRSQVHGGAVARRHGDRAAGERAAHAACRHRRRRPVRHGAERHRRELHDVRAVPASAHQGQGDARRHLQGLQESRPQPHSPVQRQVCVQPTGQRPQLCTMIRTHASSS